MHSSTTNLADVGFSREPARGVTTGIVGRKLLLALLPQLTKPDRLPFL